MILLDTSVWIDFFRGTDSIYGKILHELIEKERDICLADIILTEILQGIKDDEDFEDIKKYLLEFPIYSAKNVETYIRAAQIYRACLKKGKLVKKTIDCIIAAITIENGLEIFHNDTDFNLIAGYTGLKIFRT